MVVEVRRARARRIGVAAAMVVLVLGWLVGGRHGPQALAAQIDGAITGVTVSPPSAGPGDPIRVDLDWAVPDSAGAGDTFTLTLPVQLRSLSASFTLTAPGGAVVAVATVVNGEVTFTLTDYADRHDDLHGTAFFSTKWDVTTVPTSGPVSLQFSTSTTVFHQTVVKTDPDPVDRSQPRKSGHWVTPGVMTGPDPLEWVIDSPDGPFDRATFADTLGPGQSVDCTTVTFQLGSGLDAGGHASTYQPLPTGQVISSSCTSTGLTVVAGPVLADQIIRIRYAVRITDPSLPSYSNAVDVTVDTTRYGTVTDRVKVYSGGGDGFGTESPRTSPTESPTRSRTESPSTSPTTSRTESPSTSPTTSPTTAPTVRPTKLTASPTTTSAGLPFTGADVGPLLVVAGLLLGGGAVFVVAGRHPRARSHRRH